MWSGLMIHFFRYLTVLVGRLVDLPTFILWRFGERLGAERLEVKL